jgi:hypothetical protein
MPAPSTPEARHLHREVQALIEQATVQQAESSASAYASRAVRGTTVTLKGKRRPSTRVVRWGNQ